jgi:hypothetical protein
MGRRVEQRLHLAGVSVALRFALVSLTGKIAVPARHNAGTTTG